MSKSLHFVKNLIYLNFSEGRLGGLHQFDSVFYTVRRNPSIFLFVVTRDFNKMSLTFTSHGNGLKYPRAATEIRFDPEKHSTTKLKTVPFNPVKISRNVSKKCSKASRIIKIIKVQGVKIIYSKITLLNNVPQKQPQNPPRLISTFNFES